MPTLLPDPPLRLRGTCLPDGRERDLFVVDGHLTERPTPDAITLHEGGWVTPGLVDCHAHLTLASPAGDDAPTAERAAASARAHLATGVLLIREPGSPDDASRDVGHGDGLPGVVTAGRLMTPPGSYFPGVGWAVAEAELPSAAEGEARRSGGWAKVVGDWPRGGRMQPHYGGTALAEAARRVHAAGGRIAVHATCAETIDLALAAGFDSVEHGWGLAPRHVPIMRRQGTALVPTLVMTAALLADIDRFLRGIGMDAAGAARTAADGERHARAVSAAHRAGVRVLAGTDAGMVPHGVLRDEIRALRAAGLPPEAALAAGSWDARGWIGRPSLSEGAVADLVVYPADPRRDLAVLDRPLLMLRAGRLVVPAAEPVA